MKDTLLGTARMRAVAAAAAVLVLTIVAGYGIYTGERKLVGFVAFFTVVVLLRRGTFPDLYLMTITAILLSHVQFAVIQDEFERDKWIALAGFSAISLLVGAFSVLQPQWPRLPHLVALTLLVLAWYSVTWSLDPWLTFRKAGAFGLGLICAFVGAWSFATSVERVRAFANAHADWAWLVFPPSFVVLLVGGAGGFISSGRLRGIFTNPNGVGVWGSTLLPLLFALSLTHPVAWRRKASLVLLLVGIPCTWASGSRGGVLGALLGIGIYCTARWTRHVLRIAAVAGVVGAFLLLYEVDLGPLQDNVNRVLRPESLATLSDRKFSWDMALLISQNRPWLGHGWGLQDMIFPFFGIEQFAGHFAPSLHNSYLDAKVGLGWTGLALLVALIALGTFSGLRTWWRDRDGDTGLLALALCASMVSVAAHSVVENIIVSMGNPWSLPFWVSLALCVKLDVLQRAERRALAAAAAAPRAVALQPLAAAT